MKRTMLILLAGLFVVGQGIAQKRWGGKERRGVYNEEKIERTFTFAAGVENRRLVVDNINGTIDVVGYDGDKIEMKAVRGIDAEDDEKADEARREVVLEIKEEKGKVILYVDAPWRTRNGINYRGWHYYGYDVSYDFELRVPRKTSLFLKTVNSGKIIVKDVEGEHEVSHVNGGIDMTDIIGPAKVTTVNGPVKVSFSKNPEGDCIFKTVNGKVEVELHDGLSADLKLKTFNGQVYTDFDVIDLPRKVAALEERSGRKRVYRKGDSFSVRVGKGGPEFSFDTLNGSIYILKQK